MAVFKILIPWGFKNDKIGDCLRGYGLVPRVKGGHDLKFILREHPSLEPGEKRFDEADGIVKLESTNL